MDRLLVKYNESVGDRRTVYFNLVATDGVTAVTTEGGGQPQIGSRSMAWTNTGIGTLTHVGNGLYWAEVTQAAVATPGSILNTRYKSANTAECPGDGIQVIGFDPYAVIVQGTAPSAPAPTLGYSTGYCDLFDMAGFPAPYDTVEIARVDIDVTTGQSYLRDWADYKADASGRVTAVLQASTDFKIRRDRGVPVAFTSGVGGSVFTLPGLLGSGG